MFSSLHFDMLTSSFQTSTLQLSCSHHTTLVRSSYPTSEFSSGLLELALGSTPRVSLKFSVSISFLTFGSFCFLSREISKFDTLYRVNHWLVLITFLQHTDPLLPHYRAPEFTFPRGALATLDRSLLGDLGSFMGWIGAVATHGISETHILHHVSSKIPHYHA